MFDSNHLSLRLVRLKPSEEWLGDRNGVSFIFPKRGVGRYSSGQGINPLEPGDILVMSCNPDAKLAAANSGELIFWQFSCPFENLFPLFSCNELYLLKSVGTSLNGPTIHAGTTALAKDCHRLLGEVPSRFDLDHRSQLLRVVALILTEEFKKARLERAGTARADGHLMRAFDKLTTNELLTLSVGELADRFACSRRHLGRLFHQNFGLSVAALRMEMRLLKAVSLLRDPTAKITQIAQEAGFNHLGLFNITFKKRFGEIPNEWRKLTQQELKAKKTMPAGSGELSCLLRANGLCPGDPSPKSPSGVGSKSKTRPGKRSANDSGNSKSCDESSVPQSSELQSAALE